MTILEMNVFNTLQAIEEEKALANIEPNHTLVVRDCLIEKVKERIGGMEVLPFELEQALEHLEREEKVTMGNTINDKYVKIIFRTL